MSATTPHLVFLGWERPVLELVTKRLLRLNTENPELFRRAIVVVPTRESSRSLRENIAEAAPQRAILMPRIIVPPQILPLDPSILATDIEQYAAWFSELDPEHVNERYPSLFPVPPAAELRQDWRLSVASQMQQLRFRLDNFLLSPQSVLNQLEGNLASRLGSMSEEESSRWADLVRLCSRVDSRLASHGKISRLDAIGKALDHLRWPGQSRLMILACLPQLPPFLQQAVSRLHGRDGGTVESWVHATESLRHRFNAFGQPDESWTQEMIPLEDTQLHIEAHAVDLAEKAVELVARRIHPGSTVTLGACDPRFTPALEQAFESRGWHLYNPGGRSLSTTELAALPEQLLNAALPPERAQALDTLLRNPVMLRLHGISTPELCCRQLDHIAQVYFPESADSLDMYCERLQQENSAYSTTLQYLRDVRSLVHQLAVSTTRPAALSSLADRLNACYPDTDPYSHCTHTLADLLRDMARFLAGNPDRLDFSAALLLISKLLSDTHLQEQEHHLCAMDIPGWLELPYAAGQHLILTGMHHGCVPETGNVNPLMPDSLCQALGLEHEASALARDSYLLRSLLASRPGTPIIVARQTPDLDPVIPSKLLLRCEAYPSRQLANRVQRLFITTEAPEQSPAYDRGDWYVRQPGHIPPPGSGQPYPPAPAPLPPEPLALIASPSDNPWADPRKPLSPSVLSSFLTCPLRFWLKYALRLDPGEAYIEHKEEADIRETGTLLHAVICELTGHFTTWREGLTAAAIAAEARSLLDTAIRQQYGATPTVATRTLQQLMADKLCEFADRHWEDLSQGWSVLAREHHAVWEPEPGLSFSMFIDRIDRHTDGRFRVIDYKSGTKAPWDRHLETISDPESYRRLMGDIPLWENQRWRDVQLPLYAAYVREQWANGHPVEIAYYHIPLAKKPVGRTPWDISPAMQDSALQAVRAASRLIRAGRCLIPAEAFGGSAYSDFGGLSPEADLRHMLHLPQLAASSGD